MAGTALRLYFAWSVPIGLPDSSRIFFRMKPIGGVPLPCAVSYGIAGHGLPRVAASNAAPC